MSGPDAGDVPDDDAGDGDASDESASDDTFDRRESRDRSSADAGTPDETRQDEPTTRRDASNGGSSRRDDPVDAGERPRPRSDGETEARTTAADAGARAGTPDPGGTSPGERRRARDDGVTIEDDGVLRWFLKTENGTAVLIRDVASSVAIVAVIGLVLFGVSGVWPPLVAVESGSMEPNMERGDLVFVVADDRFVGDDPVDGTGVVTAANGVDSGHEKFGNPGDVVVFRPDGSEYETPVIHRAEFWVEAGEDWVETKADEDVVGDATCDQVQACPADHAGFVTKGDNNAGYDQQHFRHGADTDVVRPEWITGKASFRIPWLGHVRLTFDRLLSGTVAPSPTIEFAESAAVEFDGVTPLDGDALATQHDTVAIGSAVAAGLAGGGVARHRSRR